MAKFYGLFSTFVLKNTKQVFKKLCFGIFLHCFGLKWLKRVENGLKLC